MSSPLRIVARHISRPHPFLLSRPFSTITSSPSATASRFRTGAYAALFALSAGLFTVYYFDARAAIHRYLITPAIRHGLDPGTAHRLAVRVLGSGLGPKDFLSDDERLKAELWGQTLSNPIGLAAGFDKDGEAIDGLFDLGFSWVEIGSITPKPQPGNPNPRVFLLPEDDGLINRLGFPSQGHATVLARLRARMPATANSDTPASLRAYRMLAINLGKNKESALDSTDDFVAGVRTFAPYADVLVVNVSSPNTPGLRGLQQRELLEALLRRVVEARDAAALPPGARRPRIVLKIAPDLDAHTLQDIAAAVIAQRGSVDGVIVSNTSVQRPAGLQSKNKAELGGLSGAPLKPLALAALRTLRSALPADIPLIGCGGISNGADALEYARAGAAIVQLYTGFGYAGPGTCRRIKDEVTATLAREGTTWREIVTRAVDELSLKPSVDTDVEVKASVQALIAQAEDLRALLDGLGERIATEEHETRVAAEVVESAPAAVVSAVA